MQSQKQMAMYPAYFSLAHKLPGRGGMRLGSEVIARGVRSSPIIFSCLAGTSILGLSNQKRLKFSLTFDH